VQVSRSSSNWGLRIGPTGREQQTNLGFGAGRKDCLQIAPKKAVHLHSEKTPRSGVAVLEREKKPSSSGLGPKVQLIPPPSAGLRKNNQNGPAEDGTL